MNINIEEILGKHSSNFYAAITVNRQFNATLKAQDVKAAIKEIVEAVIDKCVEEAKLKYTFRDNEINKNSILDVKQMIDYE